MESLQVFEDRLKVMTRLTTVLVGSAPLAEQAELICGEVARAFDVDACGVRLLRGNHLHWLGGVGVQDRITAPPIPADFGIGGEIIRTGLPMVINDTRSHPLTADLPVVARNSPHYFFFYSYAGAPLIAGGHLEGVIGIFSRQRVREFTESDVAFLQIAANHLAAVIANDTLYRRVEQSNENLRQVLQQRVEAERALREERAKLEQRVAARTVDLARARDEAQDGARAKSEFLANMSHEIRTPLNAIVGMSQLMIGENLTDEQKEAVETIYSSSKSLLAVLNDILDFSTIEAGKLELESVPFDLHECLADPFRILRQTALDKALEYRLEIDPALPRRVVADPGRIRQMVLNLLSNALKYTERGSVVMTARPEEEAPPGGDVLLRIEVRDTGIGVPEEKRHELFEPFRRIGSGEHRRLSSRPSGTGLGLSICHNIARLMGGRVGVDSTPGVGSTFWVVAPLRVETTDTSTRPDRAASVLHRAGPGTEMRILLAEDNPVNSRVLVRMLERLGYRDVVTVADGRSAMERAAEGRFDVILMDCQMPVMDGYEATRRIRAMDGPAARVPIIAVTAGASADEETQCRAAGMTDFLPKPIQLATLLETLERIP